MEHCIVLSVHVCSMSGSSDTMVLWVCGTSMSCVLVLCRVAACVHGGGIPNNRCCIDTSQEQLLHTVISWYRGIEDADVSVCSSVCNTTDVWIPWYTLGCSGMEELCV